MIKRYFSKYTGQQIDEAIGAIIENNIQESDLSSELIATINSWIKENGAVFFSTEDGLPETGDEKVLYIDKAKHKIYCWENGAYVEVVGGSGGAGGESKTYEMAELEGSEWLRVAKLTDITKRGQAQVTLDLSADRRIDSIEDVYFDKGIRLIAGNKHHVELNYTLGGYYDLIQSGAALKFAVNDYTILGFKPNGDYYEYTIANETTIDPKAKNFLFNITNGYNSATVKEKITLFSEYFMTVGMPYSLVDMLNAHFSNCLGKITTLSGQLTVSASRVPEDQHLVVKFGEDGETILQPGETRTFNLEDVSAADLLNIYVPTKETEQPEEELPEEEQPEEEEKLQPLMFDAYFTMDLSNTVISFKIDFTPEEDIVISSITNTLFPETKIEQTVSTWETIPLSSSVFAIDCGLNNEGIFRTDIFPITQAPEIGGTPFLSSMKNQISSYVDIKGTSLDGEKDFFPEEEENVEQTTYELPSRMMLMSGRANEQEPEVIQLISSSSVTSGGSDGSAWGVAGVTFERYEDDIFLCANVNWPATKVLKNLVVNATLNDANNVELVDKIEVTYINQIEEKGESQLIEGDIFKGNTLYQLRMKGKLPALYEGTRDEVNPKHFGVIFNDNIKILDYWNEEVVDERTGELVRKWALVQAGQEPYYLDYNDGLVQFSWFTRWSPITIHWPEKDDRPSKVASSFHLFEKINPRHEASPGALSYKFTKTSGGINIYTSEEKVFVYFNGEKLTTETLLDDETGKNYFFCKLPVFELGNDLLEIRSTKPIFMANEITFMPDLYSTEYELFVPVAFEEDFELEKFEILNNGTDGYNCSVKKVERVYHYTTHGADLFSPYNRMWSMIDKISYLENEIQYNKNEINSIKQTIESSGSTGDITELVNDLIAEYMSANYENGEEGEY